MRRVDDARRAATRRRSRSCARARALAHGREDAHHRTSPRTPARPGRLHRACARARGRPSSRARRCPAARRAAPSDAARERRLRRVVEEHARRGRDARPSTTMSTMVPAPAREHAGQDVLGEPEGREHVEPQHRARSPRHGVSTVRRDDLHAGVVDEDVDRAQRGDGAVDPVGARARSRRGRPRPRGSGSPGRRASSSSLSLRRATSVSEAPRFRYSRAIASPMPLDAPVMMTCTRRELSSRFTASHFAGFPPFLRPIFPFLFPFFPFLPRSLLLTPTPRLTCDGQQPSPTGVGEGNV